MYDVSIMDDYLAKRCWYVSPMDGWWKKLLKEELVREKYKVTMYIDKEWLRWCPDEDTAMNMIFSEFRRGFSPVYRSFCPKDSATSINVLVTTAERED